MNPVNIFSIPPPDIGEEGCSIYSAENVIIDSNQSLAVVSGTNDMGSIFYDISNPEEIKTINKEYSYNEITLLDRNTSFSVNGIIIIDNFTINNNKLISNEIGYIFIEDNSNSINSIEIDKKKNILYSSGPYKGFIAIDLKGIGSYK